MSAEMQRYIDEAEKALLHTYNRYQVVFDRGEGVYLYDMDGKKYLDFVSGIAVFALGYHNEAYNDALKARSTRSSTPRTTITMRRPSRRQKSSRRSPAWTGSSLRTAVRRL